MKRFFSFFYILISFQLSGQDPQFSQYYNAPLFINPAFAGATDCYRVGLNARTQWSGLSGSFNTGMVFADLNHEDIRSGFGVIGLYDVIGNANLTSSEISGLYSFEVPVLPQFSIRFGLQGTYVSRSVNYSKLIFDDQYSGSNGIDIVKSTTSDPTTNHNRTSYLDFSSGVLFYGEDTYWLGFSAHHINRPDQSFYMKESRLPVRFSVHGGYSFSLGAQASRNVDDRIKLVPSFIYKAQGKFDQADVGLYFIKSAFLAGIWYRGIVLKEDEKVYNSDAFIFQAGIRFEKVSFTYSFDFTTSRLQMRNTLGSHEISVIYLFCADWPARKKPPRRVRKLPCPDFKRSTR